MAGKKKNTTARYAIIGLVVAILACISTALIGAAKGMVNANIFTLPDTKGLDLALQISLALILVGIGAYAFMAPDAIRRFFTGRQARYGSNSLILAIAFTGILIAVNYFVYQNPGKPLDMTEDKSNTLAPETLQALATLPAKVSATAFYSSNLSRSSADDLLQKFKANSNGKFDYKFVDPDSDPVAAHAAGITGDGKILLTMGELKEVASTASETELTRTLIRLINPTTRAVYFLQGHGEPGVDSGGGGTLSFSKAKSTLESKNYTVNTLNLLVEHKIPGDALAIVIGGPSKPITRQEVDLLKKYVDGGGALVVMEDPTFFTDFGDSADPLADYLVSDWGIKLDNDVVIDLVNTQNPFQAISSQVSTSHPITQNLTRNYIVILPQARSISITGTVDNVTQTPIILTTDQSWGETALVANETPTFDPAADIPGPLNLAVAGENSSTKGRVVVFGNSYYATDDNFDVYGNGNIFINSVDWAAEQENLLNITPRSSTPRTFLPPTQVSFIIMVILSILVIPGAIVFLGIGSWVARRRRG